MVEAAIIVGAMVMIFDSWYALPGAGDLNGEIGVVRAFHNAMDVSAIVHAYRVTFIPALFSVLGAFFPSQIRDVFPR